MVRTEGTGETRTERDSLGTVEVPTMRLWGAQTQRSLANFAISTERMPPELILALAETKAACARVNAALGLLAADKAEAIVAAADEVIDGLHAEEFPLAVWQTGSGTQTNMNVNEVLANRASELLGGPRGESRLVHPNDDVNLGQSSNDVFPTAMHLAAARAMAARLLPALTMRCMRRSLSKAQAFADIVKIGRTHLQDATPLTLGAGVFRLRGSARSARSCVAGEPAGLCALAIGGTAVGTGLNTHPEFGARVAADLASHTGLAVRKRAQQVRGNGEPRRLVSAHGAMRTLAVVLTKIANDIRWLASGPRSGLGEIELPANEPGSSIMPGKVNPTQCEALTMLTAQVMGNDVAIGIGGASGNFELNVYKPLIAHNFLQSLRLLADGMASFEAHCVRGIVARRERIAELVERSLMLVTALTPHIGYDKAAHIAKRAHADGSSLRTAALALGDVSAEQFDRWVVPAQMVGPREA